MENGKWKTIEKSGGRDGIEVEDIRWSAGPKRGVEIVLLRAPCSHPTKKSIFVILEKTNV